MVLSPSFCVPFFLVLFQLNSPIEFMGVHLSIAKLSVLALLFFMVSSTDYPKLFSFWVERKVFFWAFVSSFVLLEFGFLYVSQFDDLGLLTRWVILYFLLLLSPALRLDLDVVFVGVYASFLGAGIIYGVYESLQYVDWAPAFAAYPDIGGLPRISGLATGPNQLGAFSAIGVWLALFSQKNPSQNHLKAQQALLFISCLSLILSGSKSCTLLAGVVWLVFVSETKGFKDLIKLSIFVISTMVWHAPFIINVLKRKIGLFSSRTDLYASFYEISAQDGNINEITTLVARNDHLHNFVLEIYRLGGLVSALSVLAILALFWKLGLSSKIKTFGVFFIAVCANLVNGSFGSSGIFQLYFATVVMFSCLAIVAETK